MNYQLLILDFMRKHKQPVSRYPNLIPDEGGEFRLSLIEEETRELRAAIERKDLYLIADGIADLLYVTFGTALTYGIPIDTIFEAVHASNMSKDVVVDRDGFVKVLKGPSYKPPKIRIHIDAAIRLGERTEED